MQNHTKCGRGRERNGIIPVEPRRHYMNVAADESRFKISERYSIPSTTSTITKSARKNESHDEKSVYSKFRLLLFPTTAWPTIISSRKSKSGIIINWSSRDLYSMFVLSSHRYCSKSNPPHRWHDGQWVKVAIKRRVTRLLDWNSDWSLKSGAFYGKSE